MPIYTRARTRFASGVERAGGIRSERGQTSPEWLAIGAFLIAVLVTLGIFAPTIAGAVGGTAQKIVCAVGGGGCGGGGGGTPRTPTPAAAAPGTTRPVSIC